jgi:hypothetical protein
MEEIKRDCSNCAYHDINFNLFWCVRDQKAVAATDHCIQWCKEYVPSEGDYSDYDGLWPLD